MSYEGDEVGDKKTRLKPCIGSIISSTSDYESVQLLSSSGTDVLPQRDEGSSKLCAVIEPYI